MRKRFAPIVAAVALAAASIAQMAAPADAATTNSYTCTYQQYQVVLQLTVAQVDQLARRGVICTLN